MIPHIKIKYKDFLYLWICILAKLISPFGITFVIRTSQGYTVCCCYQRPAPDVGHDLCPVMNEFYPQTHQLACFLTYISCRLYCSNLHGSSKHIRRLDTADYPLSSSGYYYNSSLTITNGGTDWIQQRHTSTHFVFQRVLLKWTLNSKNRSTDWIELATSQDIIQLNPVTNTNRDTFLAFMLVCKDWLQILPTTFALALHSGVAINGLKWRMGEGSVGRMGGGGCTLKKSLFNCLGRTEESDPISNFRYVARHYLINRNCCLSPHSNSAVTDKPTVSLCEFWDRGGALNLEPRAKVANIVPHLPASPHCSEWNDGWVGHNVSHARSDLTSEWRTCTNNVVKLRSDTFPLCLWYWPFASTVHIDQGSESATSILQQTLGSYPKFARRCLLFCAMWSKGGVRQCWAHV